MALLISVPAAAALAAAAIWTAPGVAADDDYLHQLHARYAFLTLEQLAEASDVVCAMTNAGSISPTTVTYIRDHYDVATGVALDIVAGAVVNRC